MSTHSACSFVGGEVNPQNYHIVLNIVYITGFQELDKCESLAVRLAYNAVTEDGPRHPLHIEDVLCSCRRRNHHHHHYHHYHFCNTLLRT
jgi:hypothetical protein